ncbi:MAG: 4'-phosphopantetheinyl transferase superfamily protein [Woeseiaceae bacterium]|nr:4'-phosphopantetheinyl transferase superfamily protein [Woeseiaceae bacterium]
MTSEDLALLPASERDREFENEDRRRQFLGGRWLLRALLEQHGKARAADRSIDTAENGKPFFRDGPSFSIAHAGSLVACCVTDAGDVGIDLEFADTDRNIAGIAERFFSADEAEWLGTETADRFFMLWVLKEAWVKALGLSIFGNMQEPRFRVEPPVIVAAYSKGRERHQALFRLDGAYLALAASSELPADLAIERWDQSTRSFVVDSEVRQVART